ncbi:MAG: DUF2330 domain-containing protein [Verrucomicrobia bacterium]|nr:DUF2330 domain-containing protein [Verrucomicrobiota bacterium]
MKSIPYCRKCSNRVAVLLAALTALLLASRQARADGCYVWKWNKDADIREPAQKAIILYDGEREDLILQVKFEGSVTAFGWLIPVPGLPEISPASMDSFYELSRLTQHQSELGSGRADKQSGLQVLEYKTVGAYQTATLSATDGHELKAWLKANDFNWPDQGDRILDHYIGKMWYFVAVRINAEGVAAPDIKDKLQTGELHPLRISFNTKECIYPLKISSLNRGESKIHIYMISGGQPRICPEMDFPIAQLPVDFNQYRVTFGANSAMLKDLPRLVGRQWYLVKYSQSFQPAAMTDLTFVHPDNAVWTNACEQRLDRWLTTDPALRAKTNHAYCPVAAYYAPRAYDKIMAELSAKPDLNQLMWVKNVDWEKVVVPSDGVACLLARVWLNSHEERQRLQCGDLLIHMKGKATAGIRLLTVAMTDRKPDQNSNFLFDDTFMAESVGRFLRECPDEESLGKVIRLYRDVRKTIFRQSHGHLVHFLAETHSPAVADMIVECFDDAPATMARALVTMADQRAADAITKAILHEGWLLAGALFDSLVDLNRDAAFQCMVKAIDAEKPGVVAGHGLGRLFMAGLTDGQYELLFPHVFKLGKHPDNDPVFLRYIDYLHAQSLKETKPGKLKLIMEDAVKARGLLWAATDSPDTVIGKIARRVYESKAVEPSGGGDGKAAPPP